MTFNRPTTTETNWLDAIANAYRAAGVAPPSRTTEALEAIAAEPGADQVAAQLALDACETTDAKKFLDAALAKVARAQAADALRKALTVAGPRVALVQMPDVITQAVTDLSPAFAKMTAALTEAAAELDPTAPLSLDAAVRDDTTKALKQAHGILSTLGTFAAIHIQRPARDVPPALNRVLPLVTLPPCQVEAVIATFQSEPKAANEHELTGTRTVRALVRALERDIDAALLGIARGEYDGITFALADRDELTQRYAQARTAHTRCTASDTEARPQQVSVG